MIDFQTLLSVIISSFVFLCARSVQNEDNISADCFGWICLSDSYILDESSSFLCYADMFYTHLFLAPWFTDVSSVNSSSGCC